jgi:hypothetical protein
VERRHPCRRCGGTLASAGRMFGETRIRANRRRGGEVVARFGDAASLGGGMRLEAVIAAGQRPARRGGAGLPTRGRGVGGLARWCAGRLALREGEETGGVWRFAVRWPAPALGAGSPGSQRAGPPAPRWQPCARPGRFLLAHRLGPERASRPDARRNDGWRDPVCRASSPPRPKRLRGTAAGSRRHGAGNSSSRERLSFIT